MKYLSSIFDRFSSITELWVRENCVWNQATRHRVPPARHCVSTYVLTHDTVYVSTNTGCWIGRGCPQIWPPRSLDLEHVDYLMWKYFKILFMKAMLRHVWFY